MTLPAKAGTRALVRSSATRTRECFIPPIVSRALFIQLTFLCHFGSRGSSGGSDNSMQRRARQRRKLSQQLFVRLRVDAMVSHHFDGAHDAWVGAISAHAASM